jgi:predicted lactoylglutathione lyase
MMDGFRAGDEQLGGIQAFQTARALVLRWLPLLAGGKRWLAACSTSQGYQSQRAGESPAVFDHVTIRVSDRATSERFYDTVLPAVGLGEHRRGELYTEWGDFSIAHADDVKPVTRRLHIAFAAPSREQVDEFWRAGTEAGYRDDGAPGPRPQYGEDYYGGFLLDPDGNNVEAVHIGGVGPSGSIEHLWIRVRDVAASKQFYETIAPYSGVKLNTDTPRRAQFVGSQGSFSVVAGEPAENVHLAFAASENETVDDFYRAAMKAGYRDEGAPGERALYHAGYYGAFVLDPDGNNVEVVNHNRV